MSDLDELRARRDALRDQLAATERSLEETRTTAGGEEAARLSAELLALEKEVAQLALESDELDTWVVLTGKEAARLREEARRARQHLLDLRRGKS